MGAQVSMVSYPVYDPFPKYLQIREVLLRWLSARNVGDMLPTEEKLAKQFHVSRMTIREALKSFEEDGLIVRKARVGTWLAQAVPTIADRRATGPIENFGRLGMSTSTVLISRGLVKASPEIAAVLGMKASDEVLEIQRLRIADDEPFLLLKAYFPPAIGKKVSAIDGSDSLYVPALRAAHDPDTREELQQIEAVALDKKLAEILAVKEGAPALVVKRLFVDSTRQPVVYFVAIFRSDRYYYTAKLPRAKKTPTGSADKPKARKSAKHGTRKGVQSRA